MRTRILSVTPLNPLGVPAPLMNKGSRENGVNATTCRRYNPSVFSACKTSRKASSPYTGEPRFALRLARGAQGAAAATAASRRIANACAAVKPAEAGCPHPSRCGAAPHRATFPKGKASLSKNPAQQDFFLCIRLYVIGKEDSNERNPSGVSFVFVQVSLTENEVFRQAGLWRLRAERRGYRRALKKSPGGGFFYQSSRSSGS